MHSLSKIFTLMLIFGVPKLKAINFNYKDPNTWGDQFPRCSDHLQSPIDIPLKAGIATLEGKLRFMNHNNEQESADILNDGHTMVQRRWFSVESDRPYLTGGPLGDDHYVFEEVHAHWGDHDQFGSEHTFDGESGAAAISIVYRNRKYSTFNDALYHDDGLAIVTGLYYADAYISADDGMINFINIARDGMTIGEKKKMWPRTSPLNFDAIQKTKEYVTYHGSMTFPPCSQVVTWFVAVAEKKSKISTYDLKTLREKIELQDGDHRNDRPTQKLNDRELHIVKAE